MDLISTTIKTPIASNFERYNSPLHKNNDCVSFFGRLITPLLKDKDVLEIFKNEITPIPRETGNCQEISNYLAEQLKKEGFEIYQQPAGKGKGNIVASRNINPANNNAIILQAHMDMVYVTKPQKIKPNKRLPIIPLVNGRYMMAKNTSLGADNGIGVAMALAVARIQDPLIRNLPLQIVFTVDEETGLIGAQDLKSEHLKGRYLINLDNGNPHKILTGCAGMTDFNINAVVPTKTITGSKQAPLRHVALTIQDAPGGHSALEVSKNNVNPLNFVLQELAKFNSDISVNSIAGGDKINTIPTSAILDFYVTQDKMDQVYNALSDDLVALKKSCKGLNGRIFVKEIRPEYPVEIIDPEYQQKIVSTLSQSLKNGVITLNNDSKKPVTSQNLGVLKIADGNLNAILRIRSNSKEELAAESQTTTALLSELAGHKVAPCNLTPVWDSSDKPLTRLAIEAFKEINDKQPYLSNTHGSIEGAIFAPYVAEQISIGPEIKSMHTPAERINVDSIEPACNVLETIIKKLKDLISAN